MGYRNRALEALLNFPMQVEYNSCKEPGWKYDCCTPTLTLPRKKKNPEKTPNKINKKTKIKQKTNQKTQNPKNPTTKPNETKKKEEYNTEKSWVCFVSASSTLSKPPFLTVIPRAKSSSNDKCAAKGCWAASEELRMSTRFTHTSRLLSAEQGNPSVLKDYPAHQKSDNISFSFFAFTMQ